MGYTESRRSGGPPPSLLCTEHDFGGWLSLVLCRRRRGTGQPGRTDRRATGIVGEAGLVDQLARGLAFDDEGWPPTGRPAHQPGQLDETSPPAGRGKHRRRTP